MAVVTIQFHCVEKGSLEILNFMQESHTDSGEDRKLCFNKEIFYF